MPGALKFDRIWQKWRSFCIRLLKLIQNRTRKSDTESEIEEGEIGDQNESDFEMENSDTSERNGYKPITTKHKDELYLHTDGEMHTGEKKNKKTNNRKYFH